MSGRDWSEAQGADLAAPGATAEIEVGLLGGDLGDSSLDADLTTQRLPVKAERGIRVSAEFLALAALSVGIEDEGAIRGDVLEQDHAHRRAALRRGSRERHGVGIVGLKGTRLGKPGMKAGKRVEGLR